MVIVTLSPILTPILLGMVIGLMFSPLARILERRGVTVRSPKIPVLISCARIPCQNVGGKDWFRWVARGHRPDGQGRTGKDR
jgi:hypothetical protein